VDGARAKASSSRNAFTTETRTGCRIVSLSTKEKLMKNVEIRQAAFYDAQYSRLSYRYPLIRMELEGCYRLQTGTT
jgi:hypothetical protein